MTEDLSQQALEPSIEGEVQEPQQEAVILPMSEAKEALESAGFKVATAEEFLEPPLEVIKLTTKQLAEVLQVDYQAAVGLVTVLRKRGIARDMGKVGGTRTVLWGLPKTIEIPLKAA